MASTAPPRTPDAPGRLARIAHQISAPAAVLATLVLAWQIAVMALKVKPFVLPSPLAIVQAFAQNFGQIASGAAVTTLSFVGGFALATVVGLSLAVLVVALPRLGRGIYPLLIASQTVPTIAIAPLLIIWLGFGMTVKVVISAVIAFFPIVVSAVLGFRSVSPSAVDLMRSLPATRTDIFRKLFFPAALPTIFAGLRTASVLSVIGAVVGEFVAGGEGLASHIVIARSQFETTQVMADLLGLSLLGAVFYAAIVALEYWLLPWQRLSQRARRRSTPSDASRPIPRAKELPHV